MPLPTPALYPIDTIKTRLQAMIGGGGFKALMSSGGGKGLYAGVWGNLAGETMERGESERERTTVGVREEE